MRAGRKKGRAAMAALRAALDGRNDTAGNWTRKPPHRPNEFSRGIFAPVRSFRRQMHTMPRAFG
jgi:hypothetical protein